MFMAIDSKGNRLFELPSPLTGEHRAALKTLGLDYVTVCPDCDTEVRTSFSPRYGDFDHCLCDLQGGANA